MSRVRGDIPALMNGVSQQVATLRLPTQFELQENFYSTLVHGLKKRPPTEHVAKILSSLSSSAFTHIIDRDTTERYVVVITSGSLRVFDFDGVEKTVNAPDGWSYLTSSSPSDDIRALTVQDYTFILNRSTEISMDAGTATAVPNPQALVNILAGNYGRTYKITINGTKVAEYLVPTGEVGWEGNLADTVGIAQCLIDGTTPVNNSGSEAAWPDGSANKGLGNDGNSGRVVTFLTANSITAPNNWSVTRYQSAIHIAKTNTTDFTIAVEDGYNGNAMKVTKGTTQKFSDLPAVGPDGFIAEVAGDNSTEWDNYWVEFTKNNSADDAGTWRETVKPGTVVSLDASTMPHILVRESDGTFTFKQATWDDRQCGDDVISPDPSFVGATISDIFFHRNRLGFLSDENVIMSAAGEFFRFFRTTAVSLLDSDPIDVSASHTKVSLLKHAVPFQEGLVAFSERTQFRLVGNDLLTPKTVSMRPMVDYVASPDVRPAVVGSSLFFVSDPLSSASFASIFELLVDKQVNLAYADEVTAHCPDYIPSGVFRLTGSSAHNLLFAITTGDQGAVYTYGFFYQGDKKAQSAWSRWPIPRATVLNAEVIQNDLYLLVSRSDGVFLERLRLSPAAIDDGFNSLVHLDQRVNSADLSAPSYNSTTDRTTFTLPYTVPSGTIGVIDQGGDLAVGYSPVVYGRSTNTITLNGDLTGETLYFGVPYESRLRFSKLYSRAPDGSGGTVARIEGRTQILQMTLVFDTTGYFKVEVTNPGRATVTSSFQSYILGSPSSGVSLPVTDSGRFVIPVGGRGDQTQIDIVSDTWRPAAFLSAAWAGVWNPKSLQL